MILVVAPRGYIVTRLKADGFRDWNSTGFGFKKYIIEHNTGFAKCSNIVPLVWSLVLALTVIFCF